MLPTKIGTDSDGYIINPTSKTYIQDSFRPVVEAFTEMVQELLKNKLHSVYLYGSIGRGEAKVESSDLDLTVIVYSDLNSSEKELIMSRTESLLAETQYIITKVDYDIGFLEQVVALENKYEWGFWLKHMCTCLIGIDLSQQLPRMKPNEQVSLALNGDFRGVMIRYKKELLTTPDISSLRKRTMIKRIIRGLYLTINVQDESWSTKNLENVEILKRYFPDETLFCELETLFHSNGQCSNQILLSGLDRSLKWLEC